MRWIYNLYWDFQKQKKWNQLLDSIRKKIAQNNEKLNQATPGSCEYYRLLEEAALLQRFWEATRARSIPDLIDLVRTLSSTPNVLSSGGPVPTTVSEFVGTEAASELIELTK